MKILILSVILFSFITEGLQSLDNLEYLNLAGNSISRYHKKGFASVKDFLKIYKCETIIYINAF